MPWQGALSMRLAGPGQPDCSLMCYSLDEEPGPLRSRKNNRTAPYLKQFLDSYSPTPLAQPPAV